MNKEQKRYLKEIKALMPVYGKYEKRFFHDKFKIFFFIIKEYHRKTRNTETMRVTFYTLGCKVNQYETQEIDSTYLRKQLKRTRSIKAVVLIIVLLAVVISLCRLGFLYSLYLDGKDAIITHELVVIE